MIVRFIRQFNCYNAGERASFSDDDAQALIDRGFAVDDTPQKEAEEEPYQPQPLPAEEVQPAAPAQAEPVEQPTESAQAADAADDKSAKGRKK